MTCDKACEKTCEKEQEAQEHEAEEDKVELTEEQRIKKVQDIAKQCTEAGHTGLARILEHILREYSAAIREQKHRCT